MGREGVEAGVSVCAIREALDPFSFLAVTAGSSLQGHRTREAVLSEHRQALTKV